MGIISSRRLFKYFERLKQNIIIISHGILVYAAPLLGDPFVCHKLFLHGAPEFALCSSAIGYWKSPVQVRPRWCSALALGGFPVQLQDPRCDRHLPLSFFTGSWLRRQLVQCCLQRLLFSPCRVLLHFLPRWFSGWILFCFIYLFFKILFLALIINWDWDFKIFEFVVGGWE